MNQFWWKFKAKDAPLDLGPYDPVVGRQIMKYRNKKDHNEVVEITRQDADVIDYKYHNPASKRDYYGQVPADVFYADFEAVTEGASRPQRPVLSQHEDPSAEYVNALEAYVDELEYILNGLRK